MTPLTTLATLALLIVLSLDLFQQLSAGEASGLPDGVWLWVEFFVAACSVAALVFSFSKPGTRAAAIDGAASSGEPGDYLKSMRALQLEILDLQRKEQLLVDRAVDVICVINHDANIRSINRACERAWGYTPGQLIDKPLSLILPQTEVNNLRKTILGQVSSVERINVETSVRRKDGTNVEVSWTGYWSARESGLFCIVHDISEQKHVQRLRDEFFAMVSHDLKNPLTSILGLLSLLDRGTLGTISEHGKKLAAGAHAECHTMLRLLDDFVEIEHIESAGFELQKQSFSLTTTVDNVVTAMAISAAEKQLQLQSNCPPLTCFGDEQRIMQVLNNLVGNAIKFSPPESAVTITAAEETDAVRVCVEDHGRGIPADQLTRIFTRFSQVEPSDAKRRGAAGLGLAICKLIVEQHGGQIGVDSQPGQGSQFWFTIPKSPS